MVVRDLLAVTDLTGLAMVGIYIHIPAAHSTIALTEFPYIGQIAAVGAGRASFSFIDSGGKQGLLGGITEKPLASRWRVVRS